MVAYNGFNDILKLLLELDRIYLDFKNYLPLRSAIESDRLDTLEILMNSDKLELKLDNSYKLVHYALMYERDKPIIYRFKTFNNLEKISIEEVVSSIKYGYRIYFDWIKIV